MARNHLSCVKPFTMRNLNLLLGRQEVHFLNCYGSMMYGGPTVRRSDRVNAKTFSSVKAEELTYCRKQKGKGALILVPDQVSRRPDRTVELPKFFKERTE